MSVRRALGNVPSRSAKSTPEQNTDLLKNCTDLSRIQHFFISKIPASSESFIPKLSTSYTELSFTFTVSGSGKRDVHIQFIAGSAEGVAWFDETSLLVDEEDIEEAIRIINLKKDCIAVVLTKDKNLQNVFKKEIRNKLYMNENPFSKEERTFVPTFKEQSK